MYLARRHLGYGADEWRALPWHQRRAYVDGLRQEFMGLAPSETPTQSTDALREMGVTVIYQ